MLMIDDNMNRLAKMQESLLKVAKADRRYHLDNYIKNITEIDRIAFEELVKMMKDADKYNQTLEIELSYLEKIKETYNQLVELQMKYKSICEQYGEENLKLSDMSELKIEYVENRINAINGYLVNVENIDKNKKKIELLNEELVKEEKKREFLNKKLLIFEKKLKDDFICAQIKQVVFGRLESFSIISEYDKLGYDVSALVKHVDDLNNQIKNVNTYLSEITEKYETAKVCYSKFYDEENRRVMEEIEKEFYAIKYKYVMLKILKLLSQEVNSYDLVKLKRTEFTELVNERKECLEKLGIKNPLNILQAVDMDGQLEEINALVENVQRINDIRKEIGDLTDRTEEMINQNNDYLISLSDTKDLIESKISLNDFDITSFDDIIAEGAKNDEVPLSNQAVKVKDAPSKFRLNIAKQKAAGVIERVCKLNKKEVEIVKTKEEYIPELVIGPKVELEENKVEEILIDEPIIEIPSLSLELSDDALDDLKIEDESKEKIVYEEIQVIEPFEVPVLLNSNVEEKVDEQVEVIEDNSTLVEKTVNTDIFETTTPFSEPVLFTDRTDNDTDNLMLGAMKIISEPAMVPEIQAVPEVKEEVEVMPSVIETPANMEMVMPEPVISEEVMPDAFWVTEGTSSSKTEDTESVELSFEEQINALLAENNNESVGKKR